MIRFGKRAAAIAFVLVTTRGAFAASPADVATARELYKQGADALDAGNSAAAVDKLAAAWALLKTPVIGLKLAMAHQKLGHLIEAREAALAVVNMPKAPDETPLSASARDEADKIARAVAPRVPHLLIVLKNASSDDTTVKLDGTSIPAVALKLSRQADPGRHTITADTTDGRHAELAIVVAESETKEAIVELPPATEATVVKKPEPVTPTPTTPPQNTPPASSEQGTSSVSPVVWVGVAIAGVGLGVGAIFGGLTFGAKSSLSSSCTLPSSDGKSVCPSSSASTLSFAQTASTISTIGFVALGVGVATLVTGLFLGGHKSEPSHARVVPMLGPVSGLAGTF